ncbi:MAG: hypothetical protein HC822_20770 [Oscillochloris sp.]|nr:hypothetical protein [Oscillochloris sp.]
MRYGSAMPRASQPGSPEELQEVLRDAERTIRALERAAVKAEARYQELARAYAKTVENLTQANSSCSALEIERDMWRERAECRPTVASISAGAMQLSSAEIAALRKAMARLHHPDVGGDAARMQAWNSLLDSLERTAE